MKPHQVKEQLRAVERSAGRAATACESSPAAPGALRRRVSDWNRQCRALRAALETEGDPARIRDAVDALERAADDLVRACRQIDDGGGGLEQAVAHAHAALAELREHLH